ncbi:conserved exported hypothetical protein [uncultured Paludibacter sp.]|nr:conserved exported hypothetical protein [uncultured Paludibacter sp.]
MKSFKKILIFLLFALFVIIPMEAQNSVSTSVNQRTPEQEASKQTEKLQMELNLTPEQVKAVYQINLRYAQARQKTANRSDAMQIIKNKDEDIRRVLSNQQYEQLQSRRIPRQSVEIGDNTQYLRTNPQTRSSFKAGDGKQQTSDRNEINTRQTNQRGELRRSPDRTSSDERQYPTRESYRQQPTRSSNQNSAIRSSESRSSSSRSSNSGSSSRNSGERSSSGGRR